MRGPPERVGLESNAERYSPYGRYISKHTNILMWNGFKIIYCLNPEIMDGLS